MGLSFCVSVPENAIHVTWIYFIEDFTDFYAECSLSLNLYSDTHTFLIFWPMFIIWLV